MKNSKYKILVLSDLKETTNSTLQNALKLSEIIDANIEFFHVKKRTDIVDTDSQLSAMRNINKEYIVTEKKINNLITPIIGNEGISIQTSFAFGNIKNEIGNYINCYKPDIIVLGNRKRKVLSFVGDKISDFVLKSYHGTVIIASNDSSFYFEKELSFDFLKQERQVIQA